jgi:hypothetical protein
MRPAGVVDASAGFLFSKEGENVAKGQQNALKTIIRRRLQIDHQQ